MNQEKIDRIRHYRETHECGLLEATRAIVREDRQAALDNIERKLKSSWPPTYEQGVHDLVSLLREII